ncbi:peptidylprolyl isomerase [Brenneria izadpanahii]|uniref:Peptidylprolyl isomerase n=1 Tax=Brenneria izadpanahii TaxID=2722756 RepID=A0ABX7UYI5_9GAMM|nr:peptidylprolyl isomerase [Brenneria izadpanahii]QTF08703.1 peptidylprolyl isomerase [Brenneria izadpanahii]
MLTTLFTGQQGKKRLYTAAAVLAALALVIALWLNGIEQPAEAAADVRQAAESQAAKPVASLGALNVTRDEIGRWLTVLPPAARQEMTDDSARREQWLRQHIQEKALLAEARDKGWDKRPEVAAAMAAAEQQVLLRSYLSSVSQPAPDYPTEQQLNAAYETAKDKLVVAARYHVRQIFLSAPMNDPDAAAKVEKQAKELADRARGGKDDFAQLANQYSQDAQSVANGGDIGVQPLQNLVPEMRQLVAALQPGEVSAPVRSQAGFHIVKLEEVIPSRTATLEEVAPRLTALMRQQKQAEQAQAYLNNLLGAAPLTIDGPALQQLLAGVSPATDERKKTQDVQ